MSTLTELWGGRRRALDHPALVPGLLVAYFLATLVLFPAWTVDDAYITMRYARNLVEHGALTWNVADGQPVEGYTGLLWTLMAAGLLWAHLPALAVLDLVGTLSALAMLMLTLCILVELKASQPQRLLAAGLLVVGPWWAAHAGSGLETMLFTALVLASVLAFMRSSPWLPVLLLLTSLTRPEGVALAALLFLLGLRQRKHDPEEGFRFFTFEIVPFCLIGLGYMQWRATYYGALLPNTFYAKRGAGVASWWHVVAFLTGAVLLPAVAWLESKPDLSRLRPVRGLVVALGLFCVLLMGLYGSSELLMNYSHRFFVPLLPLITIGLAATWGQVRWRSFTLIGHVVICLMTLIGGAIWTYNYELMERTEQAPAAAWIAAHTSPDSTLAVVVDAGLVPYQTGLRTIDVGALNDSYLARVRDPRLRLDYLFNQHPEVVMLATGDLGIVAAEATRTALLADPRWRNGYELAATFHGPQRGDYHQQVWVRKGVASVIHPH